MKYIDIQVDLRRFFFSNFGRSSFENSEKFFEMGYDGIFDQFFYNVKSKILEHSQKFQTS